MTAESSTSDSDKNQDSSPTATEDKAMATGAIYFTQCENKETSKTTEEQVKQHISGDAEAAAAGTTEANVTVLGPSSLHQSAITIKEYCLQLFRQHGLHRNEREMVLSEEDQMVALQLSLAEKNKQITGDYDVEMSKVLEYNKKITLAKLGLGQTPMNSDAEYQEISDLYQNFLKSSNVTDFMEVLARLRVEINTNQVLQKQIQTTHFMVLSLPHDSVEKCMLEFLAEGKKVYRIRVEVSLDDSLIVGDAHFEPSTIEAELTVASQQSSPGLCLSTPRLASPASRNPQASVSEVYAERIFLSYIHLIANSRSEIALARAINVPDRGLDHKAFTDIKRHAKNRNMPMFQTASSYIMRIRLGGKSYAPDPNSPLAQHVKGIGEFTDLAHKLQTVIEEDDNSSSAVRRVIGIIKNTIVKSKDCCVRRQSVEAVAERLRDQALQILQGMEETAIVSPDRPAHAGGSVVGRKSLRLLRALLDHAAAQQAPAKAADVLTDAFSSQHTPVRFPSLLSQFRSPLELSPDAKHDKSLAQRMQEKLSQKQKTKTVVPRFGACMDWAQPLHSVDFNNKLEEVYTNTTAVDECIPSKTVVHQAQTFCTKKAGAPSANRVVESLADQENLPDGSTATIPNQSCRSSSTEGATDKGVMKKRTADTMPLSQPCSKKAKKTQSRPSKKKTLPLQKGQKQLTAFFRM